MGSAGWRKPPPRRSSRAPTSPPAAFRARPPGASGVPFSPRESESGRAVHPPRLLQTSSPDLPTLGAIFSFSRAPRRGLPSRPRGAGAAAGAGSPVRGPGKQRTSGGTYLRRRRLSSPRTSHRPASRAREGGSGFRAAAGGSG
ncbi:hypothetical protein R6Z07F_005966 [Ovis aries]